MKFCVRFLDLLGSFKKSSVQIESNEIIKVKFVIILNFRVQFGTIESILIVIYFFFFFESQVSVGLLGAFGNLHCLVISESISFSFSFFSETCKSIFVIIQKGNLVISLVNFLIVEYEI